MDNHKHCKKCGKVILEPDSSECFFRAMNGGPNYYILGICKSCILKAGENAVEKKGK